MSERETFLQKHPEPEIKGRLWAWPFEYYATAIGYLCQATAYYEDSIRLLIGEMIKGPQELPHVLMESTPATIQAKTSLALKIASLIDISSPWFDELKQNTDFYCQHINPKRNRVIHDMWMASDTGPRLWDKRTQLKKDASFQAEKANLKNPEPIDVQDVWNLVNLADYLTDDMRSLYMELSLWIGQR